MNKIKSIEINAFRAFKDSEKFDFINHEFNEVSNLIVLYAPNGSGKTSFIDAIEWGFTGKINRINGNPVVTGVAVFCKTFLHNIAKKKYTPLRLKFFSDYFGLDRAFLSRKLSPVKLKMCA